MTKFFIFFGVAVVTLCLLVVIVWEMLPGMTGP